VHYIQSFKIHSTCIINIIGAPSLYHHRLNAAEKSCGFRNDIQMQIKLIFWKKMYTRNNLILYSSSRLVLDRFAALRSKYRILSISQSVRDIKISIWNSFAVDI